MEVEMPIKKQNDVDHIRKAINAASSKNNTSLIFFSIFLLYILISVLNTTDLMLLLPEHTFKMPLINFDLNLIAFYILAPTLLLMLHFNILFNYYMYLKKIDTHKDKLDVEALEPSVYEYAFTLSSKGFIGFMIHLFLWIWIYLIPLYILIFIYQRFADYHSLSITVLHGIIIILDIIFIILSFYFNKEHLKDEHISIRSLRYIFIYIFILPTGLIAASYFFIFFKPVTDEYNKDLIASIDDKYIYKMICKITTEIPSSFFGYWNIVGDKNNNTDYTNCFPRLTVNEAEMAKISPDALYIPRYMIENYTVDQNHLDKEDKDKKKKDIEKKLILEYGARTNLIHRNLRYADLSGCILTRADLRFSDLQGANLQKSHLQAADLSSAKLQDTVLVDAILDESIWIEKNDKNSKKTFSGINLSSAKSNGKIYFNDLNFTDITMHSVKFKSADFSKTILVRADISRSTLTDVIFEKSDLSGASLRGSDLTGAIFLKSTLFGADLSEVYKSKQDSNITLKSILKAADEDANETETLGTRIGGIIISKQKSMRGGTKTSKQKSKDDKNHRYYFNASDLTTCQEYLTIEDDSDGFDNIHVRNIKNLDKGIEKYTTAHPDCEYIKHKELSEKLEIMLRNSCKRLKSIPNKNPLNVEFMESCRSVESICIISDLCSVEPGLCNKD